MPRELILKGSVQGVACRYYCSRYGKRMGLAGSASNLRDGNVRVLLDTDDDGKVRQYIEALRTNPAEIQFWGAITAIEVREYDGPIGGDYTF